ncbi:MAG: hypothetical protein AAF922_06390 [Pseudomonadota bacterium]
MIAKDHDLAGVFQSAIAAAVDFAKKQRAARKAFYIAQATTNNPAFDGRFRFEQISDPRFWVTLKRALWYHAPTL